jgi:hypothetical protein
MPTDSPIAVAAPEAGVPAALPRTQRATFAHEWLVVFRHEFKRLMLSRRALLPMALYAGFAVMTLSMLHFGEQQAQVQREKRHLTDQEVERGTKETLAKALTESGWGDPNVAEELVGAHVPLTILSFFVLVSYFLPLLVSLVTFDQFSELSTRGARFTLLRIRRETYVAGKAVAAIAGIFIFLGAMWLVVAIWTTIRGDKDELFSILTECGRSWIMMCVLAIPYLSITAIISSLAAPGIAFIGNVGALLGLWFGALLIQYALPWLFRVTSLTGLTESSQKLLIVFPWQHAHRLISRGFFTMLAGVLGLLLIAGFGYAATLFIVRRRDV